MMEPVFILSLPRSGSTVLQRVLASHPDIATTSEPWLLLPLIYSFREKGVVAEYEHHNLARALEDYCMQLPNGKEEFFSEMKEFVLRLYARAGGEARFFLDKTPRYHLIVDELFQMFPNCKIILLWRNPLSIIASMIETWGEGKWDLHWFHIDIYKGLEALIRLHEAENERIFTLRFEDFVTNPEFYNKKLLEYLDLPLHESALDKFTDVNLEGRMGDPTGINLYRTINQDSLNKWKSVLASPVRKIWCRRYLDWIGKDRLADMGYNINELRGELAEAPISMNRVFSDVARIGYGPIYRLLQKKCLKS